ncbi:hypothetical protein ACFYTS_26060 [Nocardia sp. NPDC004151]|uniref:hypothetical protein n=1 Tax=Nocardia sp. NPDC004151 TaxID=3364304 RepID=UPI0036CFB60D
MTLRFTAGATAATALGLGALTLFGAGSAMAAPGTVTWTDNGTVYNRTVSNTTPSVGEKITITTKFERTNATDEQINWLKDWHPTCLTYVTDSAKVIDSAGTHGVEPYLEIRPDFIAGDFTATSYKVIIKKRLGDVQPATFSAQYTVGADCAKGAAMTTGVEYLSNLGHHADFKTQGPSITVGGTPGGGPGGTGSADALPGGLGSLLSGFGSSR